MPSTYVSFSLIISNEKAHWCFINVSQRRESQATAFPGNQPLPSYFQIFNMKLKSSSHRGGEGCVLRETEAKRQR